MPPTISTAWGVSQESSEWRWSVSSMGRKSSSDRPQYRLDAALDVGASRRLAAIAAGVHRRAPPLGSDRPGQGLEAGGLAALARSMEDEVELVLDRRGC